MASPVIIAGGWGSPGGWNNGWITGSNPPSGGGGGSSAPAWVPANAKIHIDFLGGSPQGRAWSNGAEVAVNTLVGHDANTEGGWDASGYDPANLTVNGYVASNAVLALLGVARSMFLAGATIRAQWRATSEIDAGSIAALSADGNDAIEASLHTGHATISSWNGDLSNSILDIVNSGIGAFNAVAITLTNTRADFAVNGSAAVSGSIGDDDRPAANPLVCVVVDGSYPDAQALQSITIYDPLPTTAGLSELSAVL